MMLYDISLNWPLFASSCPVIRFAKPGHLSHITEQNLPATEAEVEK